MYGCPLDEITARHLVDSVEAEGLGRQTDAPQKLVTALAHCLDTNAELNASTGNFAVDLAKIRLSGFDNVELSVFLSGSTEHARLKAFASESSNGIRVAVVLGSSAQVELRDSLLSRTIRLDRYDLLSLLRSWDAISDIKRLARSQIRLGSLVPFSVRGEASINMFQGRLQELSRLLQRQDCSFAVMGPSHIGKSSLLRYYKHIVRRESPSLAGSTFRIDMFGYSERTPRQVLRHIAMAINPNQYSDSVDERTFPQFLKRLGKTLREQPTLLLDEADSICDSPALDILAEMIKSRLCRCVLTGRGDLMRKVLDPKSHIFRRLDTIRLGPMERGAAAALLLEPLNDLGLDVSDSEVIAGRVLDLTGRLPSYIQVLGEKLCEHAIENDCKTVSASSLDVVLESFDVRQALMGSFEALQEPFLRLMAIRLGSLSDQYISDEVVGSIAMEEGVSLSETDLNELCSELVVNQILIWTAQGYSIANRMLHEHLFRAAGRDKALEAARRSLKQRPPPLRPPAV